MDNFTLYFNELSVNFKIFPKNPSAPWEQCISELIKLFEEAKKIRPETRIAFPSSSWHADCDGVALSERIRVELSSAKDRYRQFLSRVKRVDEISLDREVSFLGNLSQGLQYTELSVLNWKSGWAISLPTKNTHWDLDFLNVDVQWLDENGSLIAPIKNKIGHIAHADHIASSVTEIEDWGLAISASSFLTLLDGHPIVMYSAPLEHEPPHLHLLESPSDHRTIAKFEIDPFKRIKGADDHDSRVKNFVDTYKSQLLHSWKRCQRGGHPYVLK
jgi:hypothetical protein